MRFGETHWLWLLPLLPLMAVLALWALRRRERDLARWCDPVLWNRMVADRLRGIGYLKAGLLVLALFFLILMAARPQLGSRILSVKRKGIDVMIALDCSESMLAEDLQPNRMTRARQEIQALIDRMRGDRVGLVAFAGEAFVQCPLTLDYAAARMFLRFMDTNLIPVPGTAMAEAVRAGVRSFDPKERKFKALVLITDGEDHEGNLKEAAKEAKDQGVRVFAVGIGSTKGEPIPLADNRGGVRDYKRDREGNVVMTRFDPAALRDMCEETGGRLYDGNAGTLALDRLYAEISGMEQKELKGGIVTQYEDRYGYFAAAALVLLTLEWVLGEKRRRRSAAGLRGRGASTGRLGLFLLLLGFLLPGPLQAADKGTRAYNQGNYAAARDAYEQFAREHPNDPRVDYDLGTAMHQTGEMGPAEETLRRALRSPDAKLRGAAFYNLGNTRARAGNLQGALEAYELALRLAPKDKDAKHNLELIRTLLQQQPPDSSQKKQEQQQQKKDRQKDQKDQKNQSGQNQQQNQQQKQDQKNQEQPQQQQQQQQQSQDQQKQQDQQQKEDQPEQAKSATPLKVSPEQARQILNGLAQQEMLLQQERLRAKSRELRVEKDW